MQNSQAWSACIQPGLTTPVFMHHGHFLNGTVHISFLKKKGPRNSVCVGVLKCNVKFCYGGSLAIPIHNQTFLFIYAKSGRISIIIRGIQ